MSDTAPVPSTNGESDGGAAILPAAQAGDLAAYEHLVLQHERPVFRLCYLLLRDEEAAAGLARTVLANAFTSLADCETALPLSWLLRRIVEHPLARRIWEREAASGPETAIVRQLAPEVAIITGADNRLTAHALGGLAGIDQLAIYLRFFLQLSATETAEVLDSSESEANARIAGALERLAVQLADLRQLASGQLG